MPCLCCPDFMSLGQAKISVFEVTISEPHPPQPILLLPFFKTARTTYHPNRLQLPDPSFSDSPQQALKWGSPSQRGGTHFPYSHPHSLLASSMLLPDLLGAGLMVPRAVCRGKALGPRINPAAPSAEGGHREECVGKPSFHPTVHLAFPSTGISLSP